MSVYKKIPVRYIGAFADASGYAVAARNYASALVDRSNTIDLELRAVSFEQEKTEHKLLDKLKPYFSKQVNPKIQIIHLTPENYPHHLEPNCYNIAYTTWETDKLPDFWVDLCNKVDELWVPSQWNIDVFKKSGVHKKFMKLPHGIDLPQESTTENHLDTIDKNIYLFYSIFQWIERKHPFGLLKAYFSEFKPDEQVGLALRTFRLNNSKEEQAAIRQQILALKESTNLEKLPPVYFFGDLMSSEVLDSLHRRGDCFVLPSRAEGFSLTHLEAMSYGKPVIGTNYGGNLEFMNKQNSYLCDYQDIPVFGMWMKHYNSYMNWADPSIMDIRKYMRFCYENRDLAKQVGALGKQTVQEKFNWKVIGDIMVNRLTEISRGKL